MINPPFFFLFLFFVVPLALALPLSTSLRELYNKLHTISRPIPLWVSRAFRMQVTRKRYMHQYTLTVHAFVFEPFDFCYFSFLLVRRPSYSEMNVNVYFRWRVRNVIRHKSSSSFQFTPAERDHAYVPCKNIVVRSPFSSLALLSVTCERCGNIISTGANSRAREERPRGRSSRPSNLANEFARANFRVPPQFCEILILISDVTLCVTHRTSHCKISTAPCTLPFLPPSCATIPSVTSLIRWQNRRKKKRYSVDLYLSLIRTTRSAMSRSLCLPYFYHA